MCELRQRQATATQTARRSYFGATWSAARRGPTIPISARLISVSRAAGQSDAAALGPGAWRGVAVDFGLIFRAPPRAVLPRVASSPYRAFIPRAHACDDCWSRGGGIVTRPRIEWRTQGAVMGVLRLRRRKGRAGRDRHKQWPASRAPAALKICRFALESDPSLPAQKARRLATHTYVPTY